MNNIMIHLLQFFSISGTIPTLVFEVRDHQTVFLSEGWQGKLNNGSSSWTFEQIGDLQSNLVLHPASSVVS